MDNYHFKLKTELYSEEKVIKRMNQFWTFFERIKKYSYNRYGYEITPDVVLFYIQKKARYIDDNFLLLNNGYYLYYPSIMFCSDYCFEVMMKYLNTQEYTDAMIKEIIKSKTMTVPRNIHIRNQREKIFKSDIKEKNEDS